MKRLQTTLMVFLLMFALAAPSFAGGARWAQALGLSEDQRSSIQKLHFKHMRKMIQLRAQLQILRLDLGQLLKQHKPDQQKVLALVEKQGKLQTEMRKVKILKRLQVKALLTPEQAKKAAELHRKRRKMRGHRWGRRGRWGRGGRRGRWGRHGRWGRGKRHHWRGPHRGPHGKPRPPKANKDDKKDDQP